MILDVLSQKNSSTVRGLRERARQAHVRGSQPASDPASSITHMCTSSPLSNPLRALIQVIARLLNADFGAAVLRIATADADEIGGDAPYCFVTGASIYDKVLVSDKVVWQMPRPTWQKPIG